MLDHKGFLVSLEDLRDLRLKKAKIAEDERDVNQAIDTLVRDVVEYMDSTDQLSVKVKGFGTASRTSTKHYSIDKDDPIAAEAFEAFVKNRDEWELITAPHWKKVHGYFKEKLEMNEEIPPGIKTFIKDNITIRGL